MCFSAFQDIWFKVYGFILISVADMTLINSLLFWKSSSFCAVVSLHTVLDSSEVFGRCPSFHPKESSSHYH